MSLRSLGWNKRRPPWWVLYPERFEELKASLASQPQLRLSEINRHKVIRGRFRVMEAGKVLDTFKIRIVIPSTFPRELPILYAIGGRIPTIPDRHINSSVGDTCLYVPEEWKAIRRDDSFATWFDVPVRNFFLGQLYYEQHGCFPKGCERAHYQTGMLDAYGDVLGVEPQEKTLQYWLRIVSAKASKGHWDCPCGSAKIIRKCCRDEAHAKRMKIGRSLAKEMLRRLNASIDAKKTKTRTKRKMRN